MGRAADEAGIQFRVLNRRKGPAVQGPRAQADRKLYRRAMKALIAETPNLKVIEAEASNIKIEQSGTVSELTFPMVATILCRAIVITTGTFLRGVLHIGEHRTSAGRIGSPSSVRLAAALDSLGFRLGRLKTGTPPRLDGSTIDYSYWTCNLATIRRNRFPTLTGGIESPQVPCHITRTTAEGHAIILKYLHRSAVYSGAVTSRGPRYCPSIEDKIIRFADRDSHQIFLEPEGLEDNTVYPNGISTSLPIDVQAQFISTIPGLGSARILRPGYAIEYDFVDPRELRSTLMTRRVRRALSRRADQWHDGIRGSRRPGVGCRGQCGEVCRKNVSLCSRPCGFIHGRHD